MTRLDPSRIVAEALDTFQIELPSWGFANTGTRFGKYLQPAAAATIEEKCSDAGQVHALTGACPTVALACPMGFSPRPRRCRRRCGRRRMPPASTPGAINPNVFQDQHYKFGSFGNPDRAGAAARRRALRRERSHRDSSCSAATCRYGLPTGRIIRAPPASVQRKHWFEEGLSAVHAALGAGQRMLVEYKPFEPAFYHTDIADWGMALLLARERRAERQGAGRYRPSLPVAEHRADRRVAPRRGDAGRLPFQRSPLRRRRSDDGLDRSVPDLSHLSRDSILRTGTGRSRRRRLRRGPEPQPEGQDRSDAANGDERAGALRESRARRSRAPGRRAAIHRSGSRRKLPAGCVQDRRPRRDRRVAAGEGPRRRIRSRRSVRAAISSASPRPGARAMRPAVRHTRRTDP